MKFIILLLLQLQLAYSYSLANIKMLGTDREMLTDLKPGVEQRFLIRRAEFSAPVFMYVTPCGGIVHWRLYQFEHHNLEGLPNLLRMERIDQSPKLKLIAGEADNRRMKFFSNKLHDDYLLLVLSSDTTASTRVFLSSSEYSINEYYPQLPHDTRLAAAIQRKGRDRKQALITWKIADSIRSDSSHRYRTCAIVSRREANFAVCDVVQDGLESIKCVSNQNNSIVVNNLRPGRQYFITVFIRDFLHGTTASYNTLEVNTRKPQKHRVRMPRKAEVRLLPDSNMRVASLSARKRASLSYYYAIPYKTNRTQVLLIAHACNGPVRITIYHNGQILKKTDPFSGYRRFLISKVYSGQLRFEVSNENDEAKSVRLWASTRRNKSPYPMLPDDTSVKVVHRTKDSVTLQWLRARDIRAEYCIYKRQENSHYLEHLVSKVDNLCEGNLSSELIGCYQHKGIKSKTIKDPVGVIETTVAGLNPSTTHRFDLLATPLRRRGAQSLPYRTVWVRTLPAF